MFGRRKAESGLNAQPRASHPSMMRWRTGAFAAWCGVVVLAFAGVLRDAVRSSLDQSYSSYVVLVPCIVAYLIWSGRASIFVQPKFAVIHGAALAAAALLFTMAVRLFGLSPGTLALVDLKLLSVFLLFIAGFVAAYGTYATKKSVFPFLLLVLMLPAPPVVVEKIVYFLRTGSTALSYALFSAIGIPVYRDGFLLRVPRVTIEVANECSGINSSMALLVTMLLIAREALRTTSRRVVLVLLAIPLSLVKNAVRIVVLTLLAVYVDPSFLTGRLHHQGGFVFFLLALAIMFPVLWLLQRSERNQRARGSAPTAASHAVTQAAGR
jgi:exosortase